MWHMWGWDGGWGGGMGWGWFGLMHLLWWALLIAGLVAVFRLAGGRRSRDGAGSQRPLDILRERFARGEIDKDEYEDRKRVLDR